MADVRKLPADERDAAMAGLLNVLQRRINAYGVAEPDIQRLGADRVLVQLPAVKNIEEAKKLIGQTAKLEFKEQGPNGILVPATGTINGQTMELTGADLMPGAEQVSFQGRAGLPEVAFAFNSQGAELFQQVTARLLGKPLGVFLDGQEISAPIVQAVLSSDGIITGLSLDQARLLAVQLNAGALPVPVTIQGERTVDATFGADSVHKSIIAGEIALLAVIAFLLLYYRLLGVAASGALIVYSLLTLAISRAYPGHPDNGGYCRLHPVGRYGSRRQHPDL